MSIQGFVSGYLAAANATEQIIGSLVAVQPAQIRQIAASAAATGTGVATVDLRINGVSAYTNPAHRPTLAAGAVGKFTIVPPDRSAVRQNDVVTLISVNSGNKSQITVTAVLEDP